MNRLIALSLGAAAALSFAACGDSTPAAQAKLAVIHASPDAPAVDLIVDGARAGAGLAYTKNTGYLGLPSGTRNIIVNVAGTQTAVLSASQNVDANKSYSVFATGRATASPATLGLLVVEDNLAAPAAGKAHVRFVHLSPDAPAVDIAVTGGPVLFPNRAFREFTAFTPVDAGTVNLEVRVAGTQTVALPLPNVTLAAGKIYTVWAKGLLMGSGAQALGAEIIVNNP